MKEAKSMFGESVAETKTERIMEIMMSEFEWGMRATPLSVEDFRRTADKIAKDSKVFGLPV